MVPEKCNVPASESPVPSAVVTPKPSTPPPKFQAPAIQPVLQKNRGAKRGGGKGAASKVGNKASGNKGKATKGKKSVKPARKSEPIIASHDRHVTRSPSRAVSPCPSGYSAAPLSGLPTPVKTPLHTPPRTPLRSPLGTPPLNYKPVVVNPGLKEQLRAMDAQVAKAKETVLAARMRKATEIRSKALDGMQEKRKQMAAAADARRAAIREQQRADEERRRQKQEEWAREAYYKSQPKWMHSDRKASKRRVSHQQRSSNVSQMSRLADASPAKTPAQISLDEEKHAVLKLKDGPWDALQPTARPSGDGDDFLADAIIQPSAEPRPAPVAVRAAGALHNRVPVASEKVNAMARITPDAAVPAAALIKDKIFKNPVQLNNIGDTIGFGSPLGAA